MWDRAGSLPTQSQPVKLLLDGEAELAGFWADTPWDEQYATTILDALGN